MAIRGYVLDGGGPKDSENTRNSFLTKRNGNQDDLVQVFNATTLVEKVSY